MPIYFVFLLMNTIKLVRGVFLLLLWLWNNCKTIKTPGFYDRVHLPPSVKARYVFINRNSVFGEWTKWKLDTYQWMNDASNVLYAETLQISKWDLLDYRNFFACFYVFWNPVISDKKMGSPYIYIVVLHLRLWFKLNSVLSFILFFAGIHKGREKTN